LSVRFFKPRIKTQLRIFGEQINRELTWLKTFKIISACKSQKLNAVRKMHQPPGGGSRRKSSQPMSEDKFPATLPCSTTNQTTASPDEMLNQTRQLVEETVKLSDLAHRLFWLTVVLGVFAAIRYVNMLLDFCDHS
jgi:hypothetical protein